MVALMNVVGDDSIGAQVEHVGAEILMNDGTVIALREILDDVLPIGLQVVREPVGQGEILQSRQKASHFVVEIAGLALERGRGGIEIDEQEAQERLDLNAL